MTIAQNPHTTSTSNYQSTNDFINRKCKIYDNLDARKATTPTNQMHNQPQNNHPHVHGHAHTQQLHLPLQNITK